MNSARAFALALAAALVGCTGQTASSFRYAQQDETYGVSQEFNTKVDLLFVIDSSASMDGSQKKLRQGFASFADKYMLPTWDIRVAVITMDAYLAHPAFADYLNTTMPGTVNYTSTHLTNNKASFTNPSWNTSLFDTGTGRFTNGIKYKELVPHWGADGGKPSVLRAGVSDGPRMGICSEDLPHWYFFGPTTQCDLRDFSLTLTGTAECINPTGGRTSESMCVNTLQNNTVHSGKPIISTLGPSNAAWKEQLLDDFMVNITVGSVGHGSTRGFGSLLQFLSDNEVAANPTRFFREGSVRGLVFVSDTDDQTMDLTGAGAGHTPFTDYKCDQAQLLADNGAGPITGANGFCCNRADCTLGRNTSNGETGTSCETKTIGSTTYAPSVCPAVGKLVSASSVKSSLDTFFSDLDGTSGSPNYFVTSIVVTTEASLLSAIAAHDADAVAVGDLRRVAADVGTRYIELANLVGGGSDSLDISSASYDAILDGVGRAIIEKRATFRLARAPTAQEDMLVTIRHADGTLTVLRNDQYTISGNVIQIIDLNFVLGLKSTDSVNINYQPRTAG